MKSLIQEAPSIIKAIQQAWDKAGNPVEFSVKVLERGEKNFLGMTRKPAVISFFFEPSLLAVKKHPRKKETSVDQLFEESTKGANHRKEQKQEHRQDHKSEYKQDHKQKRQKAHQEQHHSSSHESNTTAQSHHPSEQRQPRTPLQMKLTTEHVDTIKEWLDEALKIMNLAVTYSVKNDAKAITFSFNEQVLEQEEEGMLFASFAFLLMQGLKKKYRNKFKGFKLILKSPLTTTKKIS